MVRDINSPAVEPPVRGEFASEKRPGRRHWRPPVLIAAGVIIASLITVAVIGKNGQGGNGPLTDGGGNAQASPAETQDQRTAPITRTSMVTSNEVSSTAAASSLPIPASLPTSTWRSGDEAMAMGLSGFIEEGLDGCLYLNSFGTLQLLIWPAGYARAGNGEDLQVLNGEGRDVAKLGTSVLLGGGNSSDSPIDYGCEAAKDAPVFIIQSDIIVQADQTGSN